MIRSPLEGRELMTETANFLSARAKAKREQKITDLLIEGEYETVSRLLAEAQSRDDADMVSLIESCVRAHKHLEGDSPYLMLGGLAVIGFAAWLFLGTLIGQAEPHNLPIWRLAAAAPFALVGVLIFRLGLAGWTSKSIKGREAA